eukprot:scaffold100063_cov75-Phaeocystis_antarctica.AAC.1
MEPHQRRGSAGGGAHCERCEFRALPFIFGRDWCVVNLSIYLSIRPPSVCDLCRARGRARGVGYFTVKKVSAPDADPRSRVARSILELAILVTQRSKAEAARQNAAKAVKIVHVLAGSG